MNALILTDLDLDRDLFNSIIPETEVIAIVPEDNNPEAITEVLSAYTDITDLHLVGNSEDWKSTFQQTPELNQYLSDNATVYFYEYQATTGTLQIQDQLLLNDLLVTLETDNTLEINPLTESTLVEALDNTQDAPAKVTTDLDDYPPGATAIITGENFNLGETIELQVLHTDGTPNTGGGHEPWVVTDGGAGDLDGLVDGNFETTWYVNPDDSAGSTFELTATGLTSGEIATHHFTDSDPAVQFFYVPGEEPDLLTAINSVDNSTDFDSVTNIETIVSITVSTDNSIIYYDHWEDGFESDIDSPAQSSTEVWGDNDPSNGIAPGFSTDVLDAGDIIALENSVVVATTDTVVDYDGRDKIGASKAIVVSRAAYPDDGDGTLIAGAVEVYDTSKWGTEYEIPIGEDLASATDPSVNFEYTSIFITASTDGTTLTLNGSQVDIDGDLDVDGDDILDEGETYFVNGGINTGDTFVASNPIQAQLLTGDVDSNYASRSYTLLPTAEWGNNYYTPVGTIDTGDPDDTETTDVFLYNPDASGSITVNYETQEGTGTVTVNGGEVARHTLTTDSGARFYTNSTDDEFFAITAFDSEDTTNDWGFSLVPESNLTPTIQVGWGPGNGARDENGNPLWVMATAATTLYIDYDGDGVAPNTDINGGQYDDTLSIGALEAVRITDTLNNDFDQSGIRVYTVDGTNLASAWGQDPSANASGTSLDLGTTVLPLPIASSWKTSALATGGDVDSDDLVDPGDTIEYTINVENDGVVVLGNVNVTDIIPDGTTYVEGSTKVNGTSIGDDTTGTAFPLDDDNVDNGIDSGRNIGNIDVDESATVSFQVTINNPYDGPLEGVTNSAIVDSDEDTFTVAVEQPIDFTDVTQTKTLYLSDSSGSNDLDRVDPTSGNETTDSTSTLNNSSTIQVRDEFSTVAYTNNDGTDNWSGDWDDQSNNSAANNGRIRVTNSGASTNPSQLRLRELDPGEYIQRSVDLTGMDSATLAFDWETDSLDTDEELRVSISNSSTGTFTSLFTAGGTSSGSQSIDITDYISNDTTLRFDSNGDLDWDGSNGDASNDFAYFDNVDISASTTNSITFNQSISMQSDFGMPSGQAVEVTAYIDVSNGTPSTSSDITANLTYDSGTLLNLTNPTAVTEQGTGTNIYEVEWQATLEDNTTIAAGEDVSLDITNNDSSVAFDLRYDGDTTFASKIDLPTIDVINITSIGIYDDTNANGGGNLLNSVSQDETVYIRVEVEDPFGDYDITSLDLDIKDSGDASILSGGVTLNETDDVDSSTDGKRIFEYAWTPTTALTTGEYTVEVEAFEGYEGTISDTDSTTITLNDGTVPDVVIGDSTVTEGTSLVFDITLSGTTTPTTDIVLDLTTTDGTATGISDYETTNFEYSIDGGTTWISAGGTNGTEVTIPAGNSGIKVRIDSTSDTTDEPDETFTLGINSVVSGSVGNTSDTGTGTILDDDDAPNISIDDVSFTEGDSNQKEFTFTVTLDNPSSETVTVDYVTSDVSATDGTDYTGVTTATTITFNPGETEKTITINVDGDTDVESDETFTVDLSNATNANISDSQGVGTILNDDSTPLFEIDDVTIVEGDSGTQVLTFTVTRSGDTTGADTIDYATADNTATTADNDYDSISGTLSFAAGETTKTISVTINGDTTPEIDDSFYVNLSNASSGTIVDSQGLGIIQNDDDSGTISGTVYADTDNDGTGDSFLSGVTIELLDEDGNSIDSDSTTSGVQPTTTTTDTNGDYSFTGVALGNYQVQQTNLSGYTDVSEVDGSTDGGADTDSGDNGVTNNIPVVLSSDGEVDSGNDFVDEEVGSISGEVLADTNNDDVGDSPLSGVTVELLDGTGTTVLATTTTNASGGYSFNDLAPGDYQVRQTNLSSYSDVKDSDTNVDGSANGAGSNTDQNLIDVSLSTGEDSTGNDFVDERGVISGTVTEDTTGDNTGEDPLANVTVELLDSSSNVVATTTTDASGNYSFTDLEPDTYTVRETDLSGYDSVIDNDDIDDDGGSGGSDDDTNTDTNNNELTVDLAAGEADTGNNFVDRAQSGVISGQVLEDTTGNGVGDTALSGVTVKLFADDGTTELDSTTTAADGTYSFSVTVSSATTYVIKEENPSNYDSVSDTEGSNDDTITISIDVGESSTGNDFVDEAQPGTISGTVQADTTGNGTGDTNLENVTLSLLDSTGSPVLDGSGNEITATTNASGFYEFTNVAPGDYQVVETDLSGYSSFSDEDSDDSDDTNSDTNDNILTVSLSAGESDTNNNFVDQQNGSISGLVQEDTVNDGSGDTPISGVTISLIDNDGNTVATTTTDSSGNYSFSDVTPGNYTVVETDPSGYSSVTDSDGDTSNNLNTIAVTLLPNETDSSNNFVDEQNGSISGSVTADTTGDDAGDTAISGVTITLRNASDDSTVATTTTDGGGNYSFTDIAPGDYEVVETTPTGYTDVNELDSVNDGSNDADNETAGADNDNILSVTLVGGESDTGNDFVDEQTGSISGTVSEDTVGGTGIAGVTITLTNTDTSTVVGTTTTASDGTYSFTDLAPGNYQIDQTDLSTYNTVSDEDSDDSDDTNSSTTDNQLIVALSAGESDTANNFVDELDTTAGTISGQVLEDTDGDGVGDTPLAGVTINLSGTETRSTITAADGTYSFGTDTILSNGSYTITEVNPDGYGDVDESDGTNDNSISVTINDDASTNNDFVDGLAASISGVVWSDFDADGLEGNFEDKVNGTTDSLTVTLTGGGSDGLLSTTGDNTSDTANIGSDGSYSFTGLNPGEEYQVEFPTSATGYTGLTTKDSGSDDTLDSDADASTGITDTITLSVGEDKTDVDAGLLPDDVIDVGGTSVSETLSGGSSDETIAGYKGQDTLTGGGGSDTFYFNESSDGVDVITDFNDAGSDKVDLRKILADEVPSATSTNVLSDGYVLFTQYSTLGTMVQVDFDGSTGSLLPKSVVLLEGDDVGTLDTTNTTGNADFIFF